MITNFNLYNKIFYLFFNFVQEIKCKYCFTFTLNLISNNCKLKLFSSQKVILRRLINEIHQFLHEVSLKYAFPNSWTNYWRICFEFWVNLGLRTMARRYHGLTPPPYPLTAACNFKFCRHFDFHPVPPSPRREATGSESFQSEVNTKHTRIQKYGFEGL